MSWSANTPTTCRSIGRARSYARQGIDLDRSTLADWVGRAAAELRPLHERLLEHLIRSPKLFMDETRAPVLDPGRRRTKTGYLWALARDDRPSGGTDVSAVIRPLSLGVGPRHESVDLAAGVAVDESGQDVGEVGMGIDRVELQVSIGEAITPQCTPPRSEPARSQTLSLTLPRY